MWSWTPSKLKILLKVLLKGWQPKYSKLKMKSWGIGA
jgi:hypothetical protein